jgi:prepilin-type N-terminal cleavage/methylation domain-containing protein
MIAMKRLTSHARKNGVTLVEMMVGVAIVGILLAVATPSLSAFMERRRVVAAAGEIASLFAFARSEANVTSGTVNMHFEPVPDPAQFSCVRISTGGTQDKCGCNKSLAEACVGGTAKLLREYILQRDTSVSFAGSATSWAHTNYVASFERGKYLDVQGLQVIIKGGHTGAELLVEYNNAGRVRTCSLNGAMSGIQPCA